MWNGGNRLLQCFSVGLIAILISLAGGLGWDSPAAAQERAMSSPALREHELQTMSKVLEESLDESGLKDWKSISVGFSPFQPLVRAQYIPTVGAIFTVPVSLPLIEPPPKPPEKATPEEEEQEPDLWEKHAGESLAPVLPLPDWFREKIVVRGSDQPLPPFHQAAPDADRQPGYDEAKVQELRRVLIETLARYGHRMEHISDKERILLVVEYSPSGLAEGIGRQFARLLEFRGSDTGDTAVRKPYGVPAAHPGAPSQRQSYLIAVGKSDLSAETSFEKLEKKVEEIRY